MHPRSVSVGCARCVSFRDCGGLSDAELFGCYFRCGQCDESCDFTCPNNPQVYSARWTEVYGKGPVELSCGTAALSLPNFLPTFYGPYRRTKVAATPWVAIPLSKLFRFPRDRNSDPIPVAENAALLRDRFRLRPDVRIIGLGVDEDYPIERLWHHHRAIPMGAWLRQMGVAAVTSPNYSYFAYAPRDHYLWNRKRSLLFAKELGDAGLPVIPHLYGETEFDFRWWAGFYNRHPQLDVFCIELQTSDAEKVRLEILVNNLKMLRDSVNRPLRLVVVGGRQAIDVLVPLFPAITVIEASAYMKTIWRQLAVAGPGGAMRWRGVKTMHEIDALMDHNVRTCAETVSEQIGTALARMERIRSAAA